MNGLAGQVLPLEIHTAGAGVPLRGRHGGNARHHAHDRAAFFSLLAPFDIAHRLRHDSFEDHGVGEKLRVGLVCLVAHRPSEQR